MSPAQQNAARPDDPQAAAGRLPDGGYSSEVQASWTEFLSTLPAAARILDMGVGNHVAALIAADLSVTRDRGWRIDAIDLQGEEQGKQASDTRERVQRIEFHSVANPAQLPFADASFDAVCGHHGLEFIDAAKALAEVHRVLKPGGDAQFLLHHAESLVVQSARTSLREADLVFNQTKAFRRLHRLVTMDQIIPKTTERATNEIRTAIRTLKAGLPVARKQGGGRVLEVALDGIQKMLAARRELKPDAVGLAVDRVEADLRASVRRLGDLVQHARGEPDMQQIERDAAAAGFTQIERIPQLHAGEHVMGWQLLLHRP